MARTASNFRKTDLQRALKAAANAGVSVERFKVGRDGTIEIFAVGQKTAAVALVTNEWDAAVK